MVYYIDWFVDTEESLHPWDKAHLVMMYDLSDMLVDETGAYYTEWSKPERKTSIQYQSVSLVAQSCPTLCDPMNRSTPRLPVHHQLPEFTQTHIHRVSDAIQPSHPLSSPSPLAPNPSQNQSFPMSQLFAWGGQSTGISALASFLPKKSQGWSTNTYIWNLER